MKLEGDYVFHGPRDEVWAMVRDPEVLAQCLPGTQTLKQISPTEYEGAIGIRIGPVSGKFSGKLTVSNELPPESCTLTVQGAGGAGFAKGVGTVHLSEEGAMQTRLAYVGELNIGGKLASVGQRLIDSVGKSIINKGFDTLDKVLAKRLAEKAATQ
ncbi:MAG: carbon monoxide dehydrogenase subunit G [Anaerolineaceae bacterium]|nr:carbon monoxide dehydrogenase subunit G [Anaerolineaceae bacterium]